MLFKGGFHIGRIWHNLAMRTAIIALFWIVIISAAHYELNFEKQNRKQITMGYMPVITNLASPILDYASREGDGLRFKALKFSSFAEMAESLRNKQIDAAFIIAPLAIELRQQGEDVKIVYIGNRHESTLVAQKDLDVNNLHDLIGNAEGRPELTALHQHPQSGFSRFLYRNDGDIVDRPALFPRSGGDRLRWCGQS